MLNQKTTFTPYYMGKPMEPAKAYTDGTFTVYKSRKGWALAHNKSGLDVNKPYTTKAEAQKAADALHKVEGIDWDTENPLQTGDQAQAGLKARKAGRTI